MKGKKSPLTPPFAYASPWILAAAIGLLMAIIIFFAVNNLQREKRIMTESLFNKGEAIIRFVGAGSRASMMMGIPDSQQVQHLIEQASGESNILYIGLVTEEGKIIAHSNTTLIGSAFAHPLLTDREPPQKFRYRIITDPDAKNKIFEVIKPFRPFRGDRAQFMKRQMHMRQAGEHHQGEATNPLPPPQSCQNFPGNTPWQDENLLIVVGLDMTEQEQVIRQDLNHMIYMSIAMLLVAIGGWIALLTAQSYRSSQKTLMNMQAFTDLLISRLPVGIIATNAQGLLQTFNHSAAALIGIPPEQCLGKAPADILPDFLQEMLTQPVDNAKNPEQEIFWSRNAAADPSHLHISSVPINDRQGESLGRVLLIHDLSEIKKLEAQIRRHDRLLALGKMAAGVAHEVRNPLSSIKGFATLLGSKFSAHSKEKEAAELMIHEVERLNRSISELLNYARPLPLNITEVEIEPFIASSLKLVQSDARELGITVSHTVDLGRKKINLDQDRLNQVLLNLYLNSLQAMEKGGKLHVSVAEGSQEGTMEIRVQDTGCGIAEGIMERVVDPYFTTKPDGTGLGLAMVYKIIDEHGGKIRIASKEKEGTTITIVLPA